MKKLLFIVFILCIQQIQGVNCLSEEENEFLQELITTNTKRLNEIGWSFENDFSKWEGLIVKDCTIISIDLSKVNIREIPNTIAYLQNLEILKVDVYREISRNLFSLPKLKILHIEGGSTIKKVLPVFYRLKNLKSLKLEAGLKDITGEILELTNLEYLDLSKNYIEEVPQEIMNLSKLKYINLSDNKYLKGSLEIFNAFNELSYLNLENTKISGGYTNASKSLKYLNLSNINMEYGILDISKSSILEVLKVKKAQLKRIKGFQYQKKLKIVDISNNFISSDKSFTFKQCKQLDSLNFSKNELTSIPGLGSSPTYVNLSSNPIFSLSTKDYKNLAGSKSIDLSFMSIDEFSSDIQLLNDCESLNLSYNNLKELPKELISFKKLKSLDVRKNKLTKFSLVLPNLKELILVQNSFTGIPVAVFENKNLEVFYIGDFELKQVPHQFLELKHLKDLYVPFVGENDEVLCKLKKKGILLKHMYVECK